MTTIYKICDQAAWRAAEAGQVFLGTEADERDGFIHFSTAVQVPGTLEKHYAGKTGLVLLAIDAEALGMALAWERSRGGEFFPHLYGPLPLSAVRWARPLADEIGGKRSLPEFDS